MPVRRTLEAPPIVEVMCGIFFTPLIGLDPMSIGAYWEQRRPDYPNHAIQPAVSEIPGIVLNPGVGPLRAWFISADEDYVLQVQADRFYFNWRRRAGAYPRFRDHDGKPGVLSRALSEFEQFTADCERRLSARPAANTIELAKIDLMIEGLHWGDFSDLGKLMPVIRDVARFSRGGDTTLAFQMSEQHGNDNRVRVNVSFGQEIVPERGVARAVRVETTARHNLPSSRGDLHVAFTELNEQVNDLFFGLLDEDEVSRFNRRIS